MAEYILNLYNYKIMETDSSDKLYWNGNYYSHQNFKLDYFFY